MIIDTTPDGKLLIRDAQIMRGSFRNFGGQKDGRYDQPGKRYIHMLIDDRALAQKMASDHWPVKILRARTPEEEPQQILKIAIKPENRYFPCRVSQVCNKVRTQLDPNDFINLDQAEITSANLTLRNWHYGEADDEYSAQLEEGIFYIQPLSYWDDEFSEEEAPF